MSYEKLHVLKEKIKQKIEGFILAFKQKDFKWENAKAIALSNTGLGVIAALIILLLVGLHFHHHKTTMTDAVNTVAWNNAMPDDEGRPMDNKNVSVNTLNNKTNSVSIAASDLKNLQDAVKNLQQSFAETNERLLVLTSQVNDEKNARKKQEGARKPYRLLGVHLDQNTNQWAADVEYNDSVLSVMAGQQFDGWHVHDVNAQGALIQ